MKVPQPSAILFVGLAVGIYFASLTTSPWFLLIALTVAVMFYYLHIRGVALLLLAGCAGYALALSRQPADIPKGSSDVHARIHAKVLAWSESSSGRDLTVKIFGLTPDSMPPYAVEPFICFAPYQSVVPAVEIGDTVAFSGFILPIPDYRDGRSSADSYFKARKSGCVAEADIDWETLIVTGKSSGNLAAVLEHLRHKASMLLAGSSLSEKSSALMSALLLGDTSWLDPDTREAFSSAGLAHILAISGLHIAVLIGMLSWVLYLLPATGRRVIPTIIILGVCWGYTIFLGLPVPVTRAAVMVSVLLLSRIFHREYHPLHALFLAGDIILAFSPQALFDIGFQLSFCSVAGIMLFAGKLIPFDPALHTRLWKLSFVFTVPLSATLATLPITATVFGVFPTYFILGNILLVWMMPFILGTGSIFLLLSALHLPAGLLGDFLNLICGFTENIASWLSALPTSRVILWHPGGVSVILYFVFLGLLYAALVQRKKILTLGTLSALCLAAAFSVPFADAHPQVYAHRTRRGATIIVESPPEAFILLSDLHGADSASTRSLYPYWKSRGISEVNFVNQAIRYNDRIIRIVDSPLSGKEGKAHIVLIDRHFRGTIPDIMRTLKPDTVLLSTNVRYGRALRYSNACHDLGIPVINLRKESWLLK